MALHDEKGPVQGAAAAQPGAEDDSWMDGLDGEGHQDIAPDMAGQAYLGMIQPDSAAAGEGNEHAGKWRNSSNGDILTDVVEVVPLAVKTVWTERASEHPYNTVGRYEPGGINVDVKPPKPGTRGFPKMTNPETGNKVEELFIYAVALKNAPEAGPLLFSPTALSMRVCKQWNSQMKSQRLPNGKIARMFSYSWFLQLKMEKNPAQPGKMVVSLGNVSRGALIDKSMFETAVQPALATSNNLIALAAPEDDAVEP